MTVQRPPKPRRQRREYRPPVGIPTQPPGRWALPTSVVLHALAILLFLAPLLLAPDAVRQALRAGGFGPAGGGGGGKRGTGGEPQVREALRFARVAPPAAPPPVAQPRIEQRPTTPRPQPPVAEPVLTPPKVDVKLDIAAPHVDLAPTPGVGGGTGSDQTGGTGPGTGGGIGTGTGTGRGSANGPGTGGGDDQVFPATLDYWPLPPLPSPKSVQGKPFLFRFAIDEFGRVHKVEFKSTGDGNYDKLLRERFSEYRFRPAHKGDGTPVASILEVTLTL